MFVSCMLVYMCVCFGVCFGVCVCVAQGSPLVPPRDLCTAATSHVYHTVLHNVPHPFSPQSTLPHIYLTKYLTCSSQCSIPVLHNVPFLYFTMYCTCTSQCSVPVLHNVPHLYFTMYLTRASQCTAPVLYDTLHTCTS